LFNWKQIKLMLKLRGLFKASRDGDVNRIISEVFRDAPREVREAVEGILLINTEGKDVKEIAREIGIKIGVKPEDLDDFVDTVISVAEEVKEYLKPRE